MRITFLNRATGTIAAALMLFGFSQAASAQGLRSMVDAEINQISSDNPGSALVFAGCAATAASEYNASGSTQRGLTVLVGCAAIGCALTDSYSNCINVNTRLFLLMLSRP